METDIIGIYKQLLEAKDQLLEAKDQLIKKTEELRLKDELIHVLKEELRSKSTSNSSKCKA